MPPCVRLQSVGTKRRDKSMAVVNVAVAKLPENYPTEEQNECYEPVIFLQDNQCYQQINMDQLEKRSAPEIGVSYSYV